MLLQISHTISPCSFDAVFYSHFVPLHIHVYYIYMFLSYNLDLFCNFIVYCMYITYIYIYIYDCYIRVYQSFSILLVGYSQLLVGLILGYAPEMKHSTNLQDFRSLLARSHSSIGIQ